MALLNCVECGKLFVKTLDKVCPDCIRKRDLDVEKIQEWIKKNQEPRLNNIQKDIGIDPKIFRKYLLEGRIRAFSSVLAPCEMCGKDTRLATKNILCADCRGSLKKAQSFKEKKELEDTELYSKQLKKF